MTLNSGRQIEMPFEQLLVFVQKGTTYDSSFYRADGDLGSWPT